MVRKSQQWLSQHMRRSFMLGMLYDVAAAAAAFALAYFSRLGFDRAAVTTEFWWHILLFTALSGPIFLVFRLNTGSWRYTSTRDLLQIVKSAVVLSAVFSLTLFAVARGGGLSRTVSFTVIPGLIVLLGTPRFVYRLYRENGIAALLPMRPPPILESRRVVIVHTLNDTAEAFIRSVKAFSKGAFQVAGIIDDRAAKLGTRVHDVRVLGATDDIGAILSILSQRNIHVEEIVVANAAIPHAELVHIVEIANAHRIKISRLAEIGSRQEVGHRAYAVPQPIALNDLLDRPEVLQDKSVIADSVAGRTVLITGAGGSIGSELARQIASCGPARLLLTDNSEFHLYRIANEIREQFPALACASMILDVRDATRVRAVFSASRPEMVFHAAALKHVSIVETNPVEGIKTNVLGTRNIADAALEFGAQAMVLISTDKAVNPASTMGVTKRAAEIYCQSLDIASPETHFAVVRFGNVLGSNGSVVPRFAEQIARGGPVTVTHRDVARFFMSIPEAVSLVLRASVHAIHSPEERGRVLVLDMGEPVNIDDLARKMIILAGHTPDIDVKIIYTGLRTGEKLREELFSANETVVHSNGGPYLVAEARAADRRLVARTMTQLQTACAEEDAAKAMTLLHHLVPENQLRETAVQKPAKPPLNSTLV